MTRLHFAATPMSTPLHLLSLLTLTATCLAQTTATYAPFGAGCPGTGTGLGAQHLLPAAANSQWGSGNAIPFGWTPCRYQQIFLGSELPTAFPMAALELRQTHSGAWAHNFAVDLEIRVGYTTRWLGTMDTTFANNWDAGPSVLVLPRTVVDFPDQLPTYPQTYSQMLLTIPWQQSFAWVPQPGRNLLVEVVVHGNSFGNNVYGYPLDNLSGTASLWGTPAAATTGNGGPVRGFGPVMSFVEQTNTAVPQLFSTDTPQIGNQFRVRIAQAHASALVLLGMGLSNTTLNGNPLPFDLAGYGAPGCDVLMAPFDTSVLFADAAGATNLQYDIPNNIYALGLHFYNQAFVVDPLANALGLAVSNGGHGLIGNQ
jgi:hypothetical protein